ncbi:MAG TPA: rhomboid family intramembrane serine protease [Acidimicrobiia bacterium]|nr:rhomboid family intramembrane serine protease [Acidimicrobiia bacterium]
MIPLRDENPTRRTPIVTLLIIGACLWLYFGWQPSLSLGQPQYVPVDTPIGQIPIEETTAFTLENAAIPCELVNGRPLTVEEVVETFSPPIDPEACQGGEAATPPLFPRKSVWLSILTSMFLHGGLAHLFGNLLFLWIFGNNIEDHMGHFRYLIFYLLGGVVATGAHVILNLDSTIPMVGASGAIAAVMGAYLVWFPDAPVRTAVFFFFIQIVDIRAKWLLGFWFISQFFTSPNSGVAWAAHVGGFVFGVIVGLMVRTSRGLRQATWTREYRALDRWDPTGGVGPGPYGRRRIPRRY